MTTALDIVREAAPWVGAASGILGGVAAWLRSKGKATETDAETSASAIAELRASAADMREWRDRAEERLSACETREDRCQEQLAAERTNKEQALSAALRNQLALERANTQLVALGVTPVGLSAVVPGEE